MSIGDQAQNKAQEIGGKAKDVAGDLTNDHSLQAEGKADQTSAKAKQTGDKAAHKVSDVAGDVADQVTSGHGVIGRLSGVGFRSEFAYIGAFASIGISLISWFISRNKTGDDKAQSDRWGIFIGHWAPTFMALGVALKLQEDN